ncbi:serpin family protein [Xylanimonas ulmi]|nr:serpin family protein [Xylanibacterium ulmi]
MRSSRRTARARAVAPALTLALALAVVAGACASDPDPQAGVTRAPGVEPRQVAPAGAAALDDVVEATRRVGVAMLAAAPEEANAVASPSSLAVALSMLADGARGGTLAQLEEVLGASGEQRRDAVAALRGALAEHDGDPAVVQDEELPEQPVVHLATQVVVDDQLTPSPQYLRTLADVYGAGVRRVDLGADTSALDDWVQHHSGGLIKKSAIEPDPDLRLVLQDAIVLAARWSSPFPQYATAPRPFTLADGSRIEAQTMAATLDVAYAEVDGWRAARLPYGDGALHADLLLPPGDPTVATPTLLADLDAALSAAAPQPVEVWLPTLDLQPDPLDLRASVAALGAPTVLDPTAADLTGLGTDDGGRRLYLGQAVQQAVFQVDEDGTRAAAVTELGVEAAGAPAIPTVELHLDRPFLIEVAHAETSWPLFLAAVRDPRH